MKILKTNHGKFWKNDNVFQTSENGHDWTSPTNTPTEAFGGHITKLDFSRISDSGVL